MRTIFFENIGRTVLCDLCNADYTDSPQTGGFIFGSNAVCPACAEHILPGIMQHAEEEYIRGYCPRDQSFADFVRAYRGGDGLVHVQSIE